MSKDFKCKDKRPCFGRKDSKGSDTGLCHVLDGQDKYPCAFCKPDQFYTDGKYYPPPAKVKK